jgi:hypothetical protein
VLGLPLVKDFRQRLSLVTTAEVTTATSSVAAVAEAA